MAASKSLSPGPGPAVCSIPGCVPTISSPFQLHNIVERKDQMYGMDEFNSAEKLVASVSVG